MWKLLLLPIDDSREARWGQDDNLKDEEDGDRYLDSGLTRRGSDENEGLLVGMTMDTSLLHSSVHGEVWMVVFRCILADNGYQLLRS